nr:MAG TPA: Very-short-patch-repair endonuclease [Caudoviricetes sp.]
MGNSAKAYEPLSAPNVKDYIAMQHDKLDKGIKTFTDGCESPIEELLAIAIRKWLPEDNVEKQKEFTFEGTTYRVDFCITRTFGIPYVRLDMEKTVVVECDGFDYHYATQEQIERDHERDRDFMAHGITVIRFTGSEINKSPDRCAEWVATILDEQTEATQFDIMYGIECKEDINEVHD